jgi:hypothetical protein
VPTSPSFQVSGGTSYHWGSSVASDAVGNFTIAWVDELVGDGSSVLAQRYGGLVPAPFAVDDGANGVIEVGDAFTLGTAWRNTNTIPLTINRFMTTRSSRFGSPRTYSCTLSDWR